MAEQTETPGQGGKLRLFPIEGGAVKLSGMTHLPEQAHGLVLLARGIDEQDESAYQHVLAQTQLFSKNKLASIVVDLFTTQERELDAQTAYFRQDAEIMQQRLLGLVECLLEQPDTQKLSIGILATGVVGAAALIAAAERPDAIISVVIADGRFEQAREALPRITVPVLLIAAAQDANAVQINQEILNSIKGNDKHLEQIQGVASLLENEESIKQILLSAEEWFTQKLVTIPAAGSQEL